MAVIDERRTGPRALSLRTIIARARQVSGLILFVYVLSHLLNHAAGIWSLRALDEGQDLFTAVWRNPVATTLLYGGLTVHVLIALRAIWLRESLRAMHPAEIAQLVLGLAIPLLLLDHAIATRYAHAAFGVNDDYTYALLNMWVFSDWQTVKQPTALVVAWMHGCVGLYLWLRYRPWFDRTAPWLLAAAVVVPAAALAGYVAASSQGAVRSNHGR